MRSNADKALRIDEEIKSMKNPNHEISLDEWEDDEDDDVDPDEDDKRIMKVFSSKKIPAVSASTMLKYRDYILKNFNKDTIFTGNQDFPWEEY